MVWLFFLALVLAALAIASSGWRQPWWHWLSKPGATLSLAAWTALAGHGSFSTYIVYGLLLSALGDLFLMFSARWFMPGLVAFLLAHLIYLAAFWQALPGAPGALNLIPLLIAAAALQHFTWAGASGMRAAIAVYSLALVAMAWIAQELWRYGLPGGPWIALGSLCFLSSDGLLAWNRFVQPLPRAQLAVLGTYFPAQAMIAWGAVLLSR